MKQIIEDIVNLSCFNDVFPRLFSKDEEAARSIYDSLKATVDKTHAVLKKRWISEKSLAMAILVEIIKVQEHAKQYLRLLSDMRKAREDIAAKANRVCEQFFEGIYDELDAYFENKKKAMMEEIVKDVSWHTSMADTARKAGSVVNKAIKEINHISQKVFKRELDLSEIDSRTYIEKLLDKHLNKEYVVKDISEIFEDNAKRCIEKWSREIKGMFPKISDFDPDSLFNSVYDIKPSFQVNDVQQVTLMGMGSALVGTMSLAAGWHTLAYSLMNVFPPIAAFTAVAAVVTGILTKDKSIENYKKLAVESVNQFYRQVILLIEVVKINELGNRTFRSYIEDLFDEAIHKALEGYRKGMCISCNLAEEDYEELLHAFDRHLQLLYDALPEEVAEMLSVD